MSMVATPVTPPGAMLLGEVKALTDTAYTTAPAAIKARSNKMVFTRFMACPPR